MRHRFYVPAELVTDADVSLLGEELHHASRVVRIREGEEVEVFNGKGQAFRAVMKAISRDAATLHLGTPLTDRRESPVAIELAMSIIQIEKFELVLQKATELGVRKITPLETDRIEVRSERYRGKAERWNRIVLEAVKQSGRIAVPVVESPIEFAEAMARDTLKFVFDSEREPAQAPPSIESVVLFVGPEGGWSEDELELAATSGALFQKLGPRRLRAETAAVTAVAIVAARYGDI